MDVQLKLLIQAESLTESTFPCWRKFIWWLAQEKAASLYFSSEITKKRRLRIDNLIQQHAPGLAMRPYPEADDEEFQTFVENTVFLSFSHPSKNPLLNENQPSGAKVIQAVDSTAEDFSGQLEICQRGGVSTLLTDRLPDEISTPLSASLQEYFLSHFLFLPPIVEYSERDLQIEKSRESTLIIYETKRKHSSGETESKTDEQEEDVIFEFSRNISHLREPLKKTGMVDFLDLSSFGNLNDSKVCQRLFRYPAWVIAVSDPQQSLYLSLLAKWRGVPAYHFEPTACSPFSFAGAGISLGEAEFSLGKRSKSIRESLQWLITVLCKNARNTVLAPKEIPANNNDLLDNFSAASQWERLIHSLGGFFNPDQKKLKESIFWKKIYRPHAGLCRNGRYDRQNLRPEIVLSLAKRALFQSPSFGSALLEAMEYFFGSDTGSVCNLIEGDSFRKQLKRLFPEYLIAYFEPDWSGKLVGAMEKYPWLPEECVKTVEELSGSPVRLEQLLENLYSSMLQCGDMPDSPVKGARQKFASTVIDGLIRHNLSPSSSPLISRLYLRSLVFLGNISEAEEIAEQVYSKNPLAKDRFCMMAQAIDETGNWSKAADYFERDLQGERASLSYIDSYARSMLRRGNLKKPVQIVCKLNETGYSTKGVITSLATDYTAFEGGVLQYCRPHGEFLSNLGELAFRMEEEIANGLSKPDTWLILGRLQNWIDQPEEALETFRNGIMNSGPGMTRTLAIEMASGLGRNHCEKDGLATLREEFGAKNASTGLLSEYARGLLSSVCYFFDPDSRHFHDHQILEAEKLLDEEIKRGNSVSFSHNLKAHCEMIRGEPDAAIQTVERALSSGKATPLVQVSNAFALWWFGFPDHARSEIRKADRLLSNNIWEMYFRAATLAVCGFTEDALRHFKGLYDANPHFFNPNRQLNRNLWFWQMAASHSLGDEEGEALYADLARNYDPLYDVKEAWFEQIKPINGEIPPLMGQMPPFRVSHREYAQKHSSFVRKYQLLQTTN